MSFWDIFTRQPGGTDAGNLLRAVSSDLSGGLLGQGDMLISQQEYDARHMSDAEFLVKYGVARSTIPLTGAVDAVSGIFTQAPITATGTTGGTFWEKLFSPINNQVQKTGEIAGESMMTGILKKYWWVFVLPFGVLIFFGIRMLYLKRNKRK
jgi:hypothetical protein